MMRGTDMGNQSVNSVRIVDNDRGAVLIMVLIILIAIIIIGISVMRTTVIENAIAGNERIVIVNFDLAESGVDFALHDYASYTSSIGLTGTYEYTTTDRLPNNISGIDQLSVRAIGKFNPPMAGAAGTSATAYSVGGLNQLKAHHYLIEAREGNETVDAAAYKIVPDSIQE